MMTQEKKIYSIEFTVIILLWTLVLAMPLIFKSDLSQDWRAVYVMWIEAAVVGVAFLVNRLVLMPRLFFAKRYAAYVVSVVGLLLLLCIFVLYFDGVNVLLSHFMGSDAGGSMPPPNMGGMPPHDVMSQRPPSAIGAPHGFAPRILPPTATTIPPSISLLIVSIFVIALDLGLRISIKWLINEQRQSEIERERVMSQLLNLQSQVSPHFFLNTLNNIHALVDIDSQRAKQTIIELSELMSYLLYESASKHSVPLQKELDFISSYIKLMRLRFSKQVKVHFTVSEPLPSVNIPPLLFLNFIENAFKYGVDYESESIIKIKFSCSDEQIEMRTINNNHSESVKGRRSGLGVINSRKRLELLYGDRYSLDICDGELIYYVTLKIPIL